MPNFEYEDSLLKRTGVQSGNIFGVDEVGRGPLAGPVVAACVHIPPSLRDLPFIPEIKDSKKLSHRALERLYALITQSFEWQVAEISPLEIDAINIHNASLAAMQRASDLMKTQPTGILVDGRHLPKNLSCPAQAIIKGDYKSCTIAAASIIAKVTRDRIMHKLHQEHPAYGWNSNVGYPTKAHKAAINQHGITDHHRKSYAPIKNFIEFGTTQTPKETAA